MLPLGPVPRTFADRVVAVGDAAGLVKPTTGGGIHYSLLSASLAADVIGQGLRTNRLHASALSRYERLWRKDFRHKYSLLAYWLQNLLNSERFLNGRIARASRDPARTERLVGALSLRRSKMRLFF